MQGGKIIPRTNCPQYEGFFNLQIIIIMIKVNKQGFVSARELREVLEIKTRFDKWIVRMFEYGFVKDRDYLAVVQKRPTAQGNITTYIEYLLTKDTAKQIAMIQRSKVGKEIREYLIELDNKKEKGSLFSSEEILNLIDMIVASQFFEFREKARKNHLDVYVPIKPKGYHYGNAKVTRNKVCGIDKNQLEKRLNKHNIKYVSVDKCLIKVDKFELVRISVIDCMMHFGKSKEYAINTGNLAKEIAKGRKDLSFTRLDTMYAVPESFSKTMELLDIS